MIKILLGCVALCYMTEASKILAVVPTASFSHQVFYQPLWKELVNRGHEVTLVTTDPIEDETCSNLTQIDISSTYEYQANIVKDKMPEFAQANKVTAFVLVNEIQYKVSAYTYSQKEIRKLFKDKSLQYDLLMLECVFVGAYAFMDRFKAPTICLTSLDAYYATHAAVGNPTHHVLYPHYRLPFNDPMSFLERLITLTSMTMMSAYINYKVIPNMHHAISTALEEDLPYPTERMFDFDMLFTNSNPLFGAVRPFTPATISLAGGLHKASSQPLPKDLQDFLDSATKGAIYFSLGSNVKSKDINPVTRNAIIKAFRELPYKVLWKFEAEELPDKPGNVKISKWLPQQDVLRHKNVKVFVTQAGVQSLEEALYANVPMVALPFFGDQEANAKRMQQRGLGFHLDHHTLTTEQFKEAVVEVINNKKYVETARLLANTIQDQPMTPLEKAVWWTEYVLRHKGAKHLHGSKIPCWHYYYLDVIAVLLTAFTAILFMLCKILKTLVRFICRMVCPYHKTKQKC